MYTHFPLQPLTRNARHIIWKVTMCQMLIIFTFEHLSPLDEIVVCFFGSPLMMFIWKPWSSTPFLFFMRYINVQWAPQECEMQIFIWFHRSTNALNIAEQHICPIYCTHFTPIVHSAFWLHNWVFCFPVALSSVRSFVWMFSTYPLLQPQRGVKLYVYLFLCVIWSLAMFGGSLVTTAWPILRLQTEDVAFRYGG
jgi:hypothetical protein